MTNIKPFKTSNPTTNKFELHSFDLHSYIDYIKTLPLPELSDEYKHVNNVLSDTNINEHTDKLYNLKRGAFNNVAGFASTDLLISYDPSIYTTTANLLALFIERELLNVGYSDGFETDDDRYHFYRPHFENIKQIIDDALSDKPNDPLNDFLDKPYRL